MSIQRHRDIGSVAWWYFALNKPRVREKCKYRQGTQSLAAFWDYHNIGVCENLLWLCKNHILDITSKILWYLKTKQKSFSDFSDAYSVKPLRPGPSPEDCQLPGSTHRTTALTSGPCPCLQSRKPTLWTWNCHSRNLPLKSSTPIPKKFYINLAFCSVLCCFSHEQRQPPSWFFSSQ